MAESEIKSIEKWHGRGSPQYDPAIHLPLLREIFSSGGGIAAFCARADIAQRTFQKWRYRHPEFQEEYEISLMKGAAWWEDYPLRMMDNKLPFNYLYWIAIGRNRYKFSQGNLKEELENNTKSRLEAAFESLKEGEITAQEYNQIASGLATESRVTELELQKQVLEQMQKTNEESKLLPDEVLKELHKAFELIKSGKGKVVLIEN